MFLENLKLFLMIFGPWTVGGIIIYVAKNNYSPEGMGIGILVIIVGYILECVIYDFVGKKQTKKINSPEGQAKHHEELLRKRNARIDEIMEKFRESSYYHVSRSVIERLLVDDPGSPLNYRGQVGISNRRGKPTVFFCYRYMCQHETWELDKLSQEMLEKKIGVPINQIPLGKSIDIGTAILKRKAFVKEYI